MNRCFTALLLTKFFAVALPLAAQEARFFRVVGPVPVTLTAVTPEGWVTWTNAPTNATFTVQTATSLGGETNWVNWVQVPVTNDVTVLRVFDPNPPAGMAFIPAGSFAMGDTFPEGSMSALPVHTVWTDEFYIDQKEVTGGLWDEVTAWSGVGDFDWGGGVACKAPDHPVHSVTWIQAIKWCNARSLKEGLLPCYYADAGLTIVYKTNQTDPYVDWSANGYRLPTEAEWEKAARGGAAGRRFPWSDSDTIQHSRANYYSSTSFNYDTSLTRNYHPSFATNGMPYTSPAGYFAPNGYGLYDMAGNVREWCWDWYSGAYYSITPTHNPRGPSSGVVRVLRGGGWSSHATLCRTPYRTFQQPIATTTLEGFRCVRAGVPEGERT